MEGRGGRSRSYSLVRNSLLGILWWGRRKHAVRLSIKDIKYKQKHSHFLRAECSFYTQLHLYLSGEIDHVQFPTNQSPTASFECINNSTPLHLSSPAFYTVHLSSSLIQLAAMHAPRWIPLLKLLDLDEVLQNEIPASPQPCQVPVLSSPVVCISLSRLMRRPAPIPRLHLAGLWLLPDHSPSFPVCNPARAATNDCFHY